MSFETLVTDLDGTLVDSGAAVTRSVREACAAVGVRIAGDRDLGFVVGPPLEESLLMLLGDPELVQPAIRAYQLHHSETAAGATARMPGAVEALERLHRAGIALGVATYKPTSIAEDVLEATGLRRFIGVVVGLGFEPGGRRKAELITDAISRLGADPATSLYVGDHDEDELGAQEAGVAFARYGERDWPQIATLVLGLARAPSAR